MKNYKEYICYILDIKLTTLENVLTKSKYHTFKVPKKSGGYRTISSPDEKLKWVQGKLNQYILRKYEFLDCQYGFVKGKSIVDNAKVHQKRPYIVNIDLKNFFPSIHFGRVRGIFMAKPFYLSNEVATVLAKIACYHNELPQGSPCSPTISNIVCYMLDKRMIHLSEQYDFSYTRYADDITISSEKPFPKEIAFRTKDNLVFVGKKLRSIIEHQGFTINETKTNYSFPKERKEVTGLIVNKKVNVKKIYIKKLRALLHRASKEGLQEAALYYFHLQKENGFIYNRKNLIYHIRNVIEGNLNFIAMVRGEKDFVYQKYLEQYLDILAHEGFSTSKLNRKLIDEYDYYI